VAVRADPEGPMNLAIFFDAAAVAVSNLVELSSLGTLDRDMLKDALIIIKSFKQHLRLRYHLNA
jgi:hypothetical protein